MKIFDLTSGFIAAAFILLGNFQSGEKTQVQDKPIIKEAKTTTQIYVYNKSTVAGSRDADNWIPSTTAPNCGPAGEVPCYITLDSNQHTDMEEFLQEHDFQTDEEVLDRPEVVTKQ